MHAVAFARARVNTRQMTQNMGGTDTTENHNSSYRPIYLLRVRLKIIGNEIIQNVGKSESCMVSRLPIIFKRTVSSSTYLCRREDGECATGLRLMRVAVGGHVELRHRGRKDRLGQPRAAVRVR